MAKVRGKIVVKDGKKIFVPVGNEVDAAAPEVPYHRKPTKVVKEFKQPLPPEQPVVKRTVSARPEMLKDVRYFNQEELWHKSVIEFFRTDPGDDPRKTYDEANIKQEMLIMGIKFGFKPNIWKVGYDPDGIERDYQFFEDFYNTLKNGKLTLVINRDEIAIFPLDMFIGEVDATAVNNSSLGKEIDILKVSESKPVALKDLIGRDVIPVTEKDKVFIRVRLGADGLPDPVADYCVQCAIDEDTIKNMCNQYDSNNQLTRTYVDRCPYSEITLEAGIVARVTRTRVA